MKMDQSQTGSNSAATEFPITKDEPDFLDRMLRFSDDQINLCRAATLIIDRSPTLQEIRRTPEMRALNGIISAIMSAAERAADELEIIDFEEAMQCFRK